MPGDGLEGDHINRDRLDNRRHNLRSIPKTAQQQNMTPTTLFSSAYRNVCWDTRRRRWRVVLVVRGHQVRVGYFEHEHDAAQAARQARHQLMPFYVD